MTAPRFYFLPINDKCFQECGICAVLGCRNHANRGLAEILRLARRAQEGGFDALVLPAFFLKRPDAAEILAGCEAAGLKTLLQVHWPVAAANAAEIMGWCGRGMGLHLVFTGSESVDLPGLTRFTEAAPDWHLTMAPGRGSPILAFLGRLPASFRERLYFHFSPYLTSLGSMTAREVSLALARIHEAFPGFSVRPPLGREVWDPRISPDLSLDSDAQPAFSYSLAESAPEVSVIIPSFNSGPLLKNTVRHLLWQKIARPRFEIIVVDDGSSDGSQDTIRNFLAPEAGQLNFKYIYFPRARSRKRGDGNFRAGIARNLGVKHAQGAILAFLDADIIVPPHYLEDILEKQKSWDVVQSVRLHLKDKKSGDRIEYSAVHPPRHAYILEESYWGPFFHVKSWGELPFFWKYTCTYSLSVKAELFKRAGWFRRTFVYYGFEDTDLGYRLARLGARFFLNPVPTFHLDLVEDRSEYRRSRWERHRILAKTAKIFFLNNLDPALYRHFASLMGGERSLGFLEKLRERLARPLPAKVR